MYGEGRGEMGKGGVEKGKGRGEGRNCRKSRGGEDRPHSDLYKSAPVVGDRVSGCSSATLGGCVCGQ